MEREESTVFEGERDLALSLSAFAICATLPADADSSLLAYVVDGEMV